MWKFNDFADNIVLVEEGGEKYTYGEFDKECAKLADALGRRCLVFNLCANEKGSLLGYASFLNAEILPVMLDSAIDRDFLFALIDSYKPDYLWIPSGEVDSFPEFKEVYSAWGYSLVKTPYDMVFPIHGELALLLTTSGSTGSPKFVRQSYGNIRANTESIVEYLKLGETERPITTLPMSYTYGLSIINTHLWVGASVILTGKSLMQKEFWSMFRDYGATSFGGVPYIYEMLDKLRFFRMELPSLKIMTQAGGKLSPELHRKFAEYAAATCKKFVVMYGQTEATARMSYLPAEKSLEKYGSMGIAIPGGEFRLIDVDGKEIDESEIVGELVYRGANVTFGYAERGGDLAKGDEWGGVLVTGDMAKRDSDGYYYIVGRKKRFLKIFGSRVNLDETERLIKASFPDSDFACGGVDDKMTVFTTDISIKDKLLEFLTLKTGLNHAAFAVVEIDSIPRSESGKILYRELSEK
jgi:acyl-CoA synthetase (AMP-forming)/AMP-acid ligase II